MHIVRVSEYVAPSPGGREVHVCELCRRQSEQGLSVRLLYRVGGERDWPFAATRLFRNSGFWNRLPHPLVSSFFLATALTNLAQRRRETDLAHFHGDYLEAIFAGAARVLGVPSLLTLHARLSPRVLRVMGFVYRLPSHVVAVSSAIAAQLAEVGVPPGRITVQPSGVDGQIFFPPPRAPEMPPLRVVVASTLIKRKDHATLYEAARLLQVEGLDVCLEVAGIGPERSSLAGLAPRRTTFHGHLDRRSLGDLMRQCHIAALSSVDADQTGEGTPTFLMEAIASGLPFVATNAGGVRELASRSHAGLVVPQRNAVELAAALRRFAEDRKLYARCRQAAISFAPYLDWDRVATRLDALMQAIADPAEP